MPASAWRAAEGDGDQGGGGTEPENDVQSAGERCGRGGQGGVDAAVEPLGGGEGSAALPASWVTVDGDQLWIHRWPRSPVSREVVEQPRAVPADSFMLETAAPRRPGTEGDVEEGSSRAPRTRDGVAEQPDPTIAMSASRACMRRLNRTQGQCLRR